MNDSASGLEPGAVVFLTPNAGIWPHALAELSLMKALAARDARIIALSCEGVLSTQCTVMHSRGINVDSPKALRASVCLDCRSANRERGRLKEVEWVTLSSLLTAQDLNQITEICSRLTVDEVSSLQLDGTPVGSLASYDTILHAKARPLDALRMNWAAYIADLRGALICMKAFEQLMLRENIQAVVVYNGLYSVNRAVWETALKVGIRALDIQATSHPVWGYEYLRIEKRLWPRFEAEKVAAWKTWQDQPLDQTEIAFAHRYLESGILATAPWAYSRARSSATRLEIFERLGLSPSTPTVSILLNSLDERIAATFVGVNVDAAWPLDSPTPIDAFIDVALSVAQQRPDWQFILRVHPRMAAGKRDGVTSPELGALLDRLATAPANVAIDWPSMGLSLFDIGLVTQCALSIGTTAGLQLMGLGIPTVLCNKNQEWAIAQDLYILPNDETTDGIEHAIEHALAMGFTLDTARKVFRFLVFKDLRSVSRVLESPQQHTRLESQPQLRESYRRRRAISLARWLISQDPTGLLSGAGIVTKSFSSRRERRLQTDSILTTKLAMTNLVDEVLGLAAADSMHFRPLHFSEPPDEAVAAEVRELQTSLRSLYALLGVDTPAWIADGREGLEPLSE